MKVFDLQCTQLHAFEGWFASEDDFQGQLRSGLLVCPICNDANIAKTPSAPRLNLGAADPAPARQLAKPDSAGQDAQAEWLRMVRHLMAHTEDVGERFAEVARQMHYGEGAARNIRGQATIDEAEALLDEGIAVVPLMVPVGLKEPLQ